MKRRDFLRTTGIGLGALTLGQYSLMAQQANTFTIRMLSPSVGVFSEQGGTIAFLTSPSGIVVVDSQFPDPAKHLITELKSLTNNTPLNLLINTHHHGDHTGGNIAFKGFVKHLVMHENAAINLNKVAEDAVKAGKKMAETYTPDITFNKDWEFQIDKSEIKAYYFGAAHTNGDALIHFENDNIVHVGDLVFNRRFPYIDKTAGANIKNWITVLEKTAKKFDSQTQFVFGHALDPLQIVGTQKDVKAFKNYLERLLDYVEKGIKAGKTLEEISKIKSIPGAEEWQGQGIERGISAAYQELS